VKDRSHFFALLTASSIVKAKPLTFSLPSNEGALLRDWVGGRSPVFFDFGDNGEPGGPLSMHALLWRLNPRSPKGKALLSPVSKTSFRDTYLKGLPLKGMDWSAELGRAFGVAGYMMRQATRSRPLAGFEQHLARMQRRRPRF
jgi:hypothetical protein